MNVTALKNNSYSQKFKIKKKLVAYYLLAMTFYMGVSYSFIVAQDLHASADITIERKVELK